MAAKTGLDFTDQIITLESKYEQVISLSMEGVFLLRKWMCSAQYWLWGWNLYVILYWFKFSTPQALKDLYTHLTPIQRVSIARHPNRPTFLDHVFNITEKVQILIWTNVFKHGCSNSCHICSVCWATWRSCWIRWSGHCDWNWKHRRKKLYVYWSSKRQKHEREY